MNRRQWKKYRKKERERLERAGLYVASNILLKNITEQILSGKIDDCGIRIKRKISVPKGIHLLGE